MLQLLDTWDLLEEFKHLFESFQNIRHNISDLCKRLHQHTSSDTAFKQDIITNTVLESRLNTMNLTCADVCT